MNTKGKEPNIRLTTNNLTIINITSLIKYQEYIKFKLNPFVKEIKNKLNKFTKLKKFKNKKINSIYGHFSVFIN